MPRTEPLTHRVTPELLAALDAARGLIPRSRYIEAAITEKVATAGVAVVQQPALSDVPRSTPDWNDRASYPRRPAPRLTGGRKPQ
jgi:hypothetical protein